MIPRARWAHTKESTARPSAWRVRARARASLALGSALACAIVTSALLLSGSVRALRGALVASGERDDAPVAAEASLHSTPAVQREIASDVSRSGTAPRAGVALGAPVARELESTPSRALQLRSIVSPSRGVDVVRGYDAMAPPVERS